MNRLVASALLSAVAVFAQTNRGAITGTVTDQSQSVVPGANITITNTRTNDVRKLNTGQSGTYSAADLDPVTYRIDVEMKGFKRSVIEDVKVDTASTSTVNVTLQAGTVDTQVTVTAEAAMLNVDSGTTGSTVTEREIQDVPLLNRSVLDLALTLPNISGDGGSENPVIVSVTTCPGCNLSVGGGRPLNTAFMADGTNNTGVSLGRTMVSFSPETVQEFTVQTTAYSAEYGTTGGGIISATTKSGSNQFAGTALWYNRNPAAAAGPFTQASANRPQPTLKSNQFSLAAGGPVYVPKLYNGNNRTFWFAAFEPNYRRDHLDQYGLLPTEGMRNGDFSGLVNTPSGWLPQAVVDQYKTIAPNAVTANDSTIYQQYNLVNGNQFSPITLPASTTSYTPFPGNVIPKNMLDASALKSLPLIVPASSYYLNSNGLISNIFTPRLLSQDEKRFTLRIDHNISENNRLNARWTSTPIVKIQGTAISPTTNGAEYSWAKQAMMAYTHTFSPTTFNDLRLNYTRGRFSTTAAPEYDAQTGSNLNTILGLPNLTKGGVPLLGGLFPGSSVGGGGSTATGLGSGGSTSADDKEERYAITDILYKNTGAMGWKFGVDASHSLQNVIPLFAALGGSYAFASTQTNSTGAGTALTTGGSPWASYLLGVANGSVTLRNTEIPYYYRWEAIAGFVQNDWKIKRNLTLNLGVRYSLQMPRTEKYDSQGVYRLDMTSSAPLPNPLTLIDGEVIRSVQVPSFVFSGRGNSRYLTPPDYKQFEPRFAFAWSPTALQSYRLTLRGGYGLSHAPVTGATRLPNPDFGATSGFATTVPSLTANPNYVMRLGENPPVLTPATPAQAIAAPANGIVPTNTLYYQQGLGGYAVSANYHTPYVQNWNLTVSWQANSSTSVELSYVGAKGTHLFLPHENVNFKDQSLLNAQIAANVNTTGTINDPLGRINPFTNRVLTVQNGTLGSPYMGFSSLYVLYDSAANSIRHAGYVNVIHRARRGLTFTANYTWAKSIDDASSAGGDKNILTPVGGQTDGQIAFGGTRANDRSVSTYDQRHVINATYIYDLPFGKGRQLMNHAWRPLEFLVGGWTMTGTLKRVSGFPYMPYLSDTNQLGDVTHTARPDLVPGVLLVNPLWDRNCPTGTGCQPYVNPSAFMRPVLGALGSSPRTLDGVRGPWSQFFNASIQKNFSLGESGKRRLQFRVDALNVFNHPVFAVYPNNAGGADFMGAPVTTPMTAAEYNTWATPNNQPLAATAAGTALLNQINANIATFRNAAGILPTNFFTVPLPKNFYGTAATSYDITTVSGYKNFRLRNAYATNFGTLYNNGTPRYVQFGVKLYF
jgi:hypothetical protein